MRKWNAILRLHYPAINIETLNDEQWYALMDEYIYVQDLKSSRLKNDMRTVLYELAKAIYGRK